MKNIRRLFITTVALLGASTLSFAQETEKTVRLKTADGKYVSMAGGGKTMVGGSTEDPKQIFSIMDANGGEIADGDEMKIRTTGSRKPTFWLVEEGKFQRRGKGSSFKIKKIEDKYAFQTADGKFVGASADGKELAIVDTQDAALKVELVAASVAAAPAAATGKPAAE